MAKGWQSCPVCAGRKSHRAMRHRLFYRVCDKCGARTDGWPSPMLADREWQGGRPIPEETEHVKA
jgi:hypothetical protein